MPKKKSEFALTKEFEAKVDKALKNRLHGLKIGVSYGSVTDEGNHLKDAPIWALSEHQKAKKRKRIKPHTRHHSAVDGKFIEDRRKL